MSYLKLIIILSNFGWSQPICSHIFHDSNLSSQYKKLQERITTLNPELVIKHPPAIDESKALEHMQFTLREEYHKVKQDPFKHVTDQLDEHIRIQFSDKYKTEEMKKEDIHLFYLNALYNLILGVNIQWKQALLKQIGITQDYAKAIALSFIDKVLNSDLRRKDLSADQAFEVMRELQESQILDSLSAFLLSNTFRDSKDESVLKECLLNDYEQWGLSEYHGQVLIQSMCPTPNKPSCCKSKPGCKNCPNNRFFLKGINCRFNLPWKLDIPD